MPPRTTVPCQLNNLCRCFFCMLSRVHGKNKLNWTDLRCKWPIGPFAFNKLIDWLTCTKLTQLHDALLVASVSVTTHEVDWLQGCELHFSSVHSSAVNTALQYTEWCRSRGFSAASAEFCVRSMSRMYAKVCNCAMSYCIHWPHPWRKAESNGLPASVCPPVCLSHIFDVSAVTKAYASSKSPRETPGIIIVIRITSSFDDWCHKSGAPGSERWYNLACDFEERGVRLISNVGWIQQRSLFHLCHILCLFHLIPFRLSALFS